MCIIKCIDNECTIPNAVNGSDFSELFAINVSELIDNLNKF